MTHTNVSQQRESITNVNTIAERLKQAREEAGLTQPELAHRAGVSAGTIGNIESGARRNPRELLAIAAAVNVRAEWLHKGRLPKRDSDERAGSSFTDVIQNVSAADLGSRRVPIIDYVQAGDWTAATDPYVAGDAWEWLVTDLDLSPSAFALQIKGESMLPDFKEGDRVIIDPEVNPQPGDFVVAKNGEEEATFKKYRPRGINERGDMVFELVPLNDDFPTIRSDVVPIRIVGTMVEHRKYRKRRG